MTKITNLDELNAALVRMIVNFPTLFSTYNDALYGLARKSSSHWDEDGNMVVEIDEPSGERTTELKTKDSPRHTAEFLQMKMDDNQKKFIRANAKDIVAAKSYHGEIVGFTDQTPGGSAPLLTNVPQNANRVLLNALVEMAEDIISYEIPVGRYTQYIPSYREGVEERLTKIKTICHAFIERTKQTDEAYRASRERMFKEQLAVLQRTAATEGFTIDATIFSALEDAAAKEGITIDAQLS